MAVTQVITNFQPGLQHVVQVAGGALYHKFRNTAGKWTNEVIAGPTGGVSKISAKFVGAPQAVVAGDQLLVTVEDDRGLVFYFAQNKNSSSWGVNQLP